MRHHETDLDRELASSLALAVDHSARGSVGAKLWVLNISNRRNTGQETIHRHLSFLETPDYP